MSVSTILNVKRGFVRSSALLVTTLALAAALPMSARAATPVAVWDGYFGDDVRAKGAYTLTYGGNKLADDASSLTITNTVGVKVDFSSSIDGNSSGFTLIFRYENMTLGATNTLATTYFKGQHDNRLGVYLDAENKPRPIWQNAVNGSTMQTQEAVEATSGVMALTYKYANGTKLYSISAGGRTTLFACSGLRGNGDKIDGCAIGGMRNSANGLRAANGMKITAIAIFDGELTESEMTDYAFPGAGKVTAAVTEDTAVSALNNTYGACADFFLTVSDGVTVNLDEPFKASFVRFSSEGTIRLAAVRPPDSSEIVKFDMNGIKGSLLRSWYRPGAVGFNFHSKYGSDTSKALVSGGLWGSNQSSETGNYVWTFEDGLSAKLSWSAGSVWAWANSDFMGGYLDDASNNGNGAEIYVAGLPYEAYDVIIYVATDSSPGKFLAKTVNGKTYTWNGTETVEGDGAWGTSRVSDAEYGVNALRVSNLSGSLSIYGGARVNQGSNRGGIAAIQIVPVGEDSSVSEIIIDATAGYTPDASVKDAVRSSYSSCDNVRIIGMGENGIQLDFGSNPGSFTSHIVFDDGVHTLKLKDAGAFGAITDNPVFEVASGTRVDFYAHDLTGYSGGQITSSTDIRVDAGGTMRLYPYGSGTVYYRGRFTIEPGATLTSFINTYSYDKSDFRMQGGAVQGHEQIYVPASESGSLSAVFTGDAEESNKTLHLHTDNTLGVGIFVGENSTLDFDLNVTSSSAAPIGKWGEGIVNFNGDLSGYKGTLTVHEGTVNVTSATTIASIVNEKGATLAYSVAARPTFTSYSGDGDVVVDISSLVDGGVIASGSYALAPASVPSYRVSVVGLPENSGFSIAETEDGIVLTDDDVFLPVWTGASGVWTSSVFDGRSGSAEGLDVVFYQGTMPQDSVSVTVDGAKSPNSMTFVADDTAYTLSGDQITTTEGITVSSAEPVVISNKLVVGGSVVLNAGTELTLATNEVSLASGALSGSGTLVLDPGEGNAFTMSTANTSYTGEAVIASGTVKMGNVTSFGAIGRTSVIRVKNNATLLVHPDCANDDEGERNSLVLEYGAKYTSTGYLDYGAYPMTKLTLEGDASIAAEQANVAVAKKYFDPIEIALGEHTLTKTGMNTLCIAAATINGAGKIDVEEGYLRLYNGYWYGPNNVCKFLEGTLRIGVGAQLQLCRYAAIGTQKDAWDANENKYSLLTVNRLELDGIVTRDDDSVTTITVNGLVTGCGTTPVLILGKNAVFKPTGTGYLTITESLTLPSVLTNDVSGINFDAVSTVPLFKVGSLEMLPEAENMAFSCGELPKRWSLEKTSDGLGYKLKKEMSFSIHLR